VISLEAKYFFDRSLKELEMLLLNLIEVN